MVIATQSVLKSPAFEQYGPRGMARAPSLAQAEAYCRELTRRHYENFTVASWLLPSHLRQPFANVYAYCRWADDLADETDDPSESLALLDWWQSQLDACYSGSESKHPVFRALTETIAQFKIPREPLANLLIAFRQDQHQTRYETFDELLDYCRHSADPVGRIVLHLGHCHNEQTATLSDSICTGLQLANHWQDIARDRNQGRAYLPQETLRAFDCPETELDATTASVPLRAAVEHEVKRARDFFNQGEPLIGLVSKDIRLEVQLFLAGGRAVLDAIERQQFDTLQRRPTVSKWKKLRLLASALVSRKRSTPQRGRTV